MKIIKNISIGLIAILFCTSCENWLDVNESPNAAAGAGAGPIFNNVLVGIATNKANDIGSSGACTQLWSGGGSLGAGVFYNPERYNFSIFTTGNTWRTWYRDSQKDLVLAAANAEAAGQNNAVAQCEIVSSLIYWFTTVLWEDVPFSEAVDIDVATGAIVTRNPKFDSQAEVLDGIITKLDAAIALIDSAPTSIVSEDLLYGGDMDSWRKFAKSLKFRALMTLVDVEPSRATEIAAMITEDDMISSASENAQFPFFDVPGNQNPFYGTLAAFAGGNNFFYFASEAMVDLMSSKNDPRVAAYFEPYPAGGSPGAVTGAPAGVQNIGFIPWVLSTGAAGSTDVVRPDAPDVWFTVQEQHFLEAEAYAMGYAPGGLAAADASLRAGITAAMETYGVSPGDITTYLTNEIPDLSTLTASQARDIIGEEYWVDCVNGRWIEGWTSWRRIESVALSVPDGASTTGLLRRLPYPPDELAANSNAPTDPDLDSKMYFDN